MKTKKNFTYGHAIGYGIAIELILVFVQYLLLTIYHSKNPASAFSFSTEYMMSSGFYIFLIPGFILYATVVFLIMNKFTMASPAYLFVFLLTAAAIELTFYLSITANYQGAFVYSILDKVIGTALGVIGYYAMGEPEVAK
ncbi:MAG: hypothetical protein HYR67_12625 [Bacteroidetes bacterium]|nr:hypothetical protein [Bacteroidota bacterium]